jgi:tRNA A37 threonylcarbamoyladenosine dehydratase
MEDKSKYHVAIHLEKISIALFSKHVDTSIDSLQLGVKFYRMEKICRSETVGMLSTMGASSKLIPDNIATNDKFHKCGIPYPNI